MRLMNIAAIMGIIMLAVLIVGGAVLLTVSVVRTVKKKKSVGGIIGGSVMMLLGIVIVCVVLGVVSFLNARKQEVAGSPRTDLTNTLIVAYFESIHGYVFDIDRLAKKGYSGDPIDESDAKDVLRLYNSYEVEYDESNTEVVTYGDIEVVRFKKSTILTGAVYDFYFECIYAAPDEDYVGIQYIRVEREGEVVRELGTKPVFD